LGRQDHDGHRLRRIRSSAQLIDVEERLSPAVARLSGLVLPKYTAAAA